MNLLLTMPEMAVTALAIGLLLLDLWTPVPEKSKLGLVAIVGVALVLAGSFLFQVSEPQYAFGQMYVLDGLAMFFKRLFLAGALLVLIMSTEFAERLETGIVEYYALILLALSGMMWAASANDFCLLFVAVELITVTFYVLISFHRQQPNSLEAGVKYLILGALASAFLVYGIALVFGSTGAMGFAANALAKPAVQFSRLFQIGLLLVLVGLGFKIAIVPFQIWVPDVYQGSPTPTTAWLAAGSKAAGFVLLLRVLFGVAGDLTLHWRPVLMAMAGATILYGNLCAIPQRNLKRLLGYSSIAQAGYLLLGVVAMNPSGASAILFYLGAYLFALMAAFTVLCMVFRHTEAEDICELAGLHQRSPLLAASLTLAMVSLAGIPPLAGFFGKLLLLKSVLERHPLTSGYVWLVGIALVGIVISLYYYFGVIRTIYWSQPDQEKAPIQLPRLIQASLYGCMAGMLYYGILPGSLVTAAEHAIKVLRFE